MSWVFVGIGVAKMPIPGGLDMFGCQFALEGGSGIVLAGRNGMFLPHWRGRRRRPRAVMLAVEP